MCACVPLWPHVGLLVPVCWTGKGSCVVSKLAESVLCLTQAVGRTQGQRKRSQLYVLTILENPASARGAWQLDGTIFCSLIRESLAVHAYVPSSQLDDHE